MKTKRSLTMVDVEKLIALVHGRPAVWDKGNKLHGNRNVVDKCWVEISEEMDTDEVVVRKKWKYLRDQFAVEWGKFLLLKPGEDPAHCQTKWQFFQPLLFLKDTIKPRPAGLRGQANHLPDQCPDAVVKTQPPEEEDSSPDSDTNHCQDHDSQDSAEPTFQRRRRNRKRVHESHEDDCVYNLLQVEERKLQYLLDRSMSKSEGSSEEVDEDFLFFKSLMPHIKNIPTHKKLRFRSRVQEVVEEFAYPTS